MRFHTVEIEARREIGAYTLLSYRWPGEGIEPGRFVMARGAGYPATLDPFRARPFSFYDFEDGVASILFEVRGRGTALLDSATETIEVTAPLGVGFKIGTTGGRAALLGGGIGVAPLKILARELAARGIDHDVFLGFLEARTAAVADEFSDAAVATMDGSRGTRGTVLDAAPDLRKYPIVYACGPNAMLAAVKGAAGPGGLRQLSVEERMSCGNGSCNGCVVPVDGGYVRSCIEGPVFRAEVLAW